MTTPRQDGFDGSAGVTEADRTLRLIAMLPAPNGLEERVKTGLQAAPSRGVLVAWPFSANGYMRAAAAAAIVLAVAGGGWGVYSHIQVAATPSAAVLPQMPSRGGGFSSAGATRKPQTLEGPVVGTPVTARQEPDSDAATPVTKAGPKAIAPAKHAHTPAKSKRAPVAVTR